MSRMSDSDSSRDASTPTAGGGEAASNHEAGRLIDIKIESELQDSYLTYAMSTIMDRALPDVRDGLKPSQRRILVAMNDLNLRPGKKHLKCAKICGDTSGNYHPHGESVIYPTMVGMAQAWKMRVPLVDPQGNFGSIDGDPPAAMRYTEARMHPAAVDMLADLKLDTVDFQPNYDDRLHEPTVLPGKFPNLLINGGMGIAVGMATSLPPHNPAEIFDGIVRTIENPDISLAELMADETDENGRIVRFGIKGPDFPTGGVILGRRGILEAYEHGRGRVTVRGEVHTEEMKNGRQQLVIDSIPYNLVQNTLVEKIVHAVKDDRIKDIADVRNESGRSARTRIVVELKKGADPAVVENQLYQHTPLQQTFSIINIALVNRQPRTLGLKELIGLYIDHRVDVIRRRTAHLLREAKKRAHVLEGMIYAVCDIDEVIALIRSSRTRPEAIEKLMERRYRIPQDHQHFGKLPSRLVDRLALAEAAGGVALTRVQAEQIGSMRLIQLVGLEIERLINEYNEVVGQIEDYESILADDQRVFSIIKDDCAEMKARYGSGEAGKRLTAIEEAAGDIDIEALIREEEVVVTITRGGFVKRVPAATYQAQGRGGKGIRASGGGEDDVVSHLFVASTHDDLLCFTDRGRVFKIKVYELPEMSRTSRGRAIQNYIQLGPGERTCAYRAVKNFESGSEHLLFVSRGGIVKRTPLKAYANVNRSGLIAVGLKDGDALFDVRLTSGQDDIILVTSTGMAIRFNEHAERGGLRDMGRSAAGVKGIELSGDARIVGTAIVPMKPDPDWTPGPGESEEDRPWITDRQREGRPTDLLTITDKGYGKRTDVDEYRVRSEREDGSYTLRSQSRGGKGRIDMKLSDKNGTPVSAFAVGEADDVVVISRGGQLVRVEASSISRYGRGAQGVRVAGLKPGDAVIAATRVVDKGDDDDDAQSIGAEAGGTAPGEPG
ncbi:MAG TPA: DNA gyrase subunit A [Phycisphaerales bacterium]|nr:DNA gyrase subunit A [Phycisphaerales bacterium]